MLDKAKLYIDGKEVQIRTISVTPDFAKTAIRVEAILYDLDEYSEYPNTTDHSSYTGASVLSAASAGKRLSEAFKKEGKVSKFSKGDKIRSKEESLDIRVGEEFVVDAVSSCNVHFYDARDGYRSRPIEMYQLVKEEINNKEESKMSNLVKKIKELTLSKEDKLFREYGVVDVDGELTCEGKDLLVSLLFEENKDKLYARVKELSDQEKADKK